MVPGLLAYPYQLARTPLAVLDVTFARRLSVQSPVRRTFDRAFGSLDLVAGRLFADQTLLRQGAERIGRSQPAAPPVAAAAPPEPNASPQPASPSAPEKRSSAARRARTTAAKSRQHDDARANQSLRTIQQRLVQTEAVTEARNHQSDAAE